MHWSFMELFSADATIKTRKFQIIFAPEIMKKPISNVTHNQPIIFWYCQLAKNRPKFRIFFIENSNLPPCDIFIMTLLVLLQKWCHFICKRNRVKGGIISECLFGVFNFFQKKNKNTSHCSKNECIPSFFWKNSRLDNLLLKLTDL